MENLQSSNYKQFRIAQLGKIYQGLTKQIATKYKRSHHLPELHYQACSISPLARTMFMLEREYRIFINTTNNKLPFEQIPIELAWKHVLQYSMLPQEQQQHATKHLNKLHMYNITTITQIPNITTLQLLSTFILEQSLNIKQPRCSAVW